MSNAGLSTASRAVSAPPRCVGSSDGTTDEPHDQLAPARRRFFLRGATALQRANPGALSLAKGVDSAELRAPAVTACGQARAVKPKIPHRRPSARFASHRPSRYPIPLSGNRARHRPETPAPARRKRQRPSLSEMVALSGRGWPRVGCPDDLYAPNSGHCEVRHIGGDASSGRCSPWCLASLPG